MEEREIDCLQGFQPANGFSKIDGTSGKCNKLKSNSMSILSDAMEPPANETEAQVVAQALRYYLYRGHG